MKKYIRKFVPEALLLLYHKTIAVLANLVYRFPSRELTVIGVTGTNGKTTTCNLISAILTEAGYRVGLTTSINFKIGEREWINRTKQGMQGRFRLQKLLRQMVREGCQYAVIETTSEGIKQYRHFGIAYKVAVFTNLTPEHIEAHGSFEKYKKAKGKLFAALKGKGVSVVNGDDEYAEYFLQFGAGEKWIYKFSIFNFQFSNNTQIPNSKFQTLEVKEYQLTSGGAGFVVVWEGNAYNFKTKLLGVFNIYNCLAAIAAALSQGVKMEIIQRALARVNPIPGRMEIIRDEKRDVTIIVDYAHDPAALKNVYDTIDELRITRPPCSPKASGQANYELRGRIIAVLGAVGGGRDKAKRPKLGTLASQYANYVILTNEDPYDDDPLEIINQIESGVKQDPKRELNKNYWKILDRREAIQKALHLARPGDIIALTGKGAEEVMAVRGGLVPWDDRKAARELLS